MSDDNRGRALDQQVLQHRDAVDVQMIGRLIEQQQVECRCSASASAARLRSPPEVVRARARSHAATDADTHSIGFHAPAFALVAHGCRSGRDRPGRRASVVAPRAGRLLAPPSRSAARPASPASMSSSDRQPGDDLQQRGSSCAIAANQADPLTVLHGQVGAVQ